MSIRVQLFFLSAPCSVLLISFDLLVSLVHTDPYDCVFKHTCPDATRSTSSSTTATIVNSSLRTFRRRRRLADLRSPIGCATIQDDDDDDDDDG